MLAGLGWRLYRLWAAAWWRRTDDERQRLLAAIAAPAVAVAKPPAPTRIERNNDAPPAGLPPLPAYRVVLPAIAVEERSLVGMSALRLAGWVSEIVAGEGPVHPDTVCARLAEAASGRASDQQALDASLRAGISEAVRSGAVRDDGGFLWAKGQDQAIPRDRSERPIDERRLARIAPAELAAAIARAVAECHGIAEADAGPSAIRVLGLGKAAGGDEAVWAEATALALRDQTISRTADRLEPAV